MICNNAYAPLRQRRATTAATAQCVAHDYRAGDNAAVVALATGKLVHGRKGNEGYLLRSPISRDWRGRWGGLAGHRQGWVGAGAIGLGAER